MFAGVRRRGKEFRCDRWGMEDVRRGTAKLLLLISNQNLCLMKCSVCAVTAVASYCGAACQKAD